MTLVLDCPRFPYRGYHGNRAECRLRIYRQPTRRPVVIVTELPDNPGTSITNRAAEMASLVTATFRLGRAAGRKVSGAFEPGPVLWFEHWPSSPQHFQRVDFTWEAEGVASKPQWSDATTARVAALVGHPVAEARP